MKKTINVKINNVGATISRPHIEESAKRNNTGITLIALIITIIVMLILVVVSVRIALTTGLFESAGKATKDWETAQDAEVELGNGKVNIGGKVYNSIDEYISTMDSTEEIHNWTRSGDEVTCSHCSITLSIGEQLNYTKTGTGSSIISEEKSGIAQAKLDGAIRYKGDQTITRDSETKWVVLGIEDTNKNGNNETLLITTLTPTEDYFYMYGVAAYNNGIEIVNKVCKDLYGEEARGMTIEDVNNCLGYTPAGGTYALVDDSGNNWIYYTTGDFETPINADKDETETTPLKQLWEDIQENAYTDDEGVKKYFTPEHPEGTTNADELGKYVIDGYWYWVSSLSGDGPYLVEDFDEEDTSNKITEKTRDLIFGPSGVCFYWLASRGVFATSARAAFGLGGVQVDTAYSHFSAFDSDGHCALHSGSIRAVVALTSEIPASLGIPKLPEVDPV